MKISQISQRNDLEYEVTISSDEGIETLIVLEDTLITLQLLKPQPISLYQYQQLKADYAIAYRQAINYLSYRLRSCHEMSEYLMKKEHEKAQVAQVITRLQDQRYLDDAIFAQAFVRTALLDLKQGPKKIQQTLRQKHNLDEEQCREALTFYSEEQQLENCCKLVEKLTRLNKKYVGRALERNVKQKIQLYGYPAPIVANAWQIWEMEQVEEAVDSALAEQAEKIYRRLQRETDSYKKRQKFQQKMYQLGFDSNESRAWFDQQEENNDEEN